MDKRILTMENVLENLTYNANNICYKDEVKPVFRVTEEGLAYKTFKLAENGENTKTTVLTNYYSDTYYDDISCYDENDNEIDIIKTHTDNRGVEYYSVDDSYWESHDKIIISYRDPDNELYEECYTKDKFYCNIPKYDYKIIDVVKGMDNLKNTNLLFVETDKEFVAVEAKILYIFLDNIAKGNINF